MLYLCLKDDKINNVYEVVLPLWLLHTQSNCTRQVKLDEAVSALTASLNLLTKPVYPVPPLYCVQVYVQLALEYQVILKFH